METPVQFFICCCAARISINETNLKLHGLWVKICAWLKICSILSYSRFFSRLTSTFNRFLVELYNIKFDDKRVNVDIKRIKNQQVTKK
jgi:hypothetical protein